MQGNKSYGAKKNRDSPGDERNIWDSSNYHSTNTSNHGDWPERTHYGDTHIHFPVSIKRTRSKHQPQKFIIHSSQFHTYATRSSF